MKRIGSLLRIINYSTFGIFRHKMIITLFHSFEKDYLHPFNPSSRIRDLFLEWEHFSGLLAEFKLVNRLPAL